MKRLVYSPSIKAWVKTDFGIVDLSPYIVKCDVYRVIDNVSTAELEFRNPKVARDGKVQFLFTEYKSDGKVLPVFHPMDPITIIFERIAGRPIQVFTGYCDTTPDVQLFPGTAKIKASCTLKKLNYTYFDPGLDFVNDFMRKYGWNLDKSTGVAGTADTDSQTNPSNKTMSGANKLNDSNIGNILYAVLNEIGGWNENNIYIQSLPSNIGSIVGKLFDEFAQDNKDANKEITKLIRDIIGSGDYGKATAGTEGRPGSVDPNQLGGKIKNERETVETIISICNKPEYRIPPELIVAIGLIEKTGKFDQEDADKKFPAGGGGQYFGWYAWLNPGGRYDGISISEWDWNRANDLKYSTEIIVKAAKYLENPYKNMKPNYQEWVERLQLGANYKNYLSNNPLYSDPVRWLTKLNQAKTLVNKYK